MRVRLLRYDDGSRAFQFGSAGTPFEFEPGDNDSTAIAFAKAVNEGLESGEEIEGEAAIQVATILKDTAAGTVVWDSENSLSDWREDIQSALPQDADGCPIGWVEDISVDCTQALVCVYANGDMSKYVVPITVGLDGCPIPADRSAWIEVTEQLVAKAGRRFSNATYSAIAAAHEHLGKLMEAAMRERTAEAEKGEKPNPGTSPDKENALSYSVAKATGAMRYTLGPLYAPMRKDAHGEWVEDDVLHKSLHEYVRDSAANGRRINLQHGDKGDIQCGEWVECVRWPYDHVIKMTDAAGEEHEVEMPAGTVYLGVVWDEQYWDATANRPKGIDGYSIGGRAVKMRDDSADLADMGYKVAKAAG
jgi:hypothetical protein